MQLKNALTYVNDAAQAYTKNKATIRKYKAIFKTIFKLNQLQKLDNGFGFTQINHSIFRAISDGHYNTILTDLVVKGLIYTNLPTERQTGIDYGRRKKITRGYKVNRDFLHSFFIETTGEKMKFYSELQGDAYEAPKKPEESQPLKPEKRVVADDVELIHFDNPIFEEGQHYNCVEVYSMLDLDISNDKTDFQTSQKGIEIWNRLDQVKRVGDRYFGWFQEMPSQFRKNLTYHGSHLKEVFDVHSCVCVMLCKVMQEDFRNPESSLSIEDIKNFETLCRSGKVYESIMEQYDIPSEKRPKVKQAVQVYINSIHQFSRGFAGTVRNWFRSNFPTIARYLQSYRVAWSEKRKKDTKMVWMDYQRHQYEHITSLQLKLYKEYGVVSFSCHDAVYCSQEDFKKVNGEVEALFWRNMDYQFLK